MKTNSRVEDQGNYCVLGTCEELESLVLKSDVHHFQTDVAKILQYQRYAVIFLAVGAQDLVPLQYVKKSFVFRPTCLPKCLVVSSCGFDENYFFFTVRISVREQKNYRVDFPLAR